MDLDRVRFIISGTLRTYGLELKRAAIQPARSPAGLTGLPPSSRSESASKITTGARSVSPVWNCWLKMLRLFRLSLRFGYGFVGLTVGWLSLTDWAEIGVMRRLGA